MVNIDINFLIGCTGAAAPEAWRLYNLRTQAVFRWSWGYLMFSIPFILLGGFIAWILEPTSKWAAFYSGLTAPVLLTTAMKDTAKAQKELEDIEAELSKSQLEKIKLTEEKQKLVAEKQKLQGTVEAFRQKISPQDLEVLDVELGVKTKYQSNQSKSIRINSTQISDQVLIKVEGNIGNVAGNIGNVVRVFNAYHVRYSRRFIYLLLTASILVIVISLSIIHNYKTLPWEAIFNVLRIFFFIFLGVIVLAAIVLLLKNLQQNRSFKEFLKGL
jgi:hypothetical protein